MNKVLAALQVEVENFILRMAAEFPLRKEQLIFLINNYDMMLAVLMVGGCTTFLISLSACSSLAFMSNGDRSLASDTVGNLTFPF